MSICVAITRRLFRPTTQAVVAVTSYTHAGTLSNSVVRLASNKSQLCWPRFVNMAEQYNKAIEALNNELQTNYAVLQQIRHERQEQARLVVQKTSRYLQQSGISLEQLDQLGVIHVSGTKGKGSTCAFCESILRHRGLKTGLFTSPHLLSVTERIRINGDPISKELFSHYFWPVYDNVVTANPPDDRPTYFKFLTVLAYNIFINEGVDVAIMEGKNLPFTTRNITKFSAQWASVGDMIVPMW